MTVIASSKARALACVRHAAQKVGEARTLESDQRQVLADAIVDAVDAGLTVREIGEAAGVSGQHVSQTYRARKEQP